MPLTANINGGIFSGPNVIGNTFTASSIGFSQIEYIYQLNGCTDTAFQDIITNESPTVLATDVIISNPLCFGESTGSANITASGGTPNSTSPNYNYNWYGENPGSLSAGVYNYTISDANNCTFSSNVTLYDPQNNLAVISSYNSSCFNANDGSIGVTINGCNNGSGTVSNLPYCNSNPNATLSAQPSAIIEEVILAGDNNIINNNTALAGDLYEDYTATMYADIEEGQSYTVIVTLNGLAAFGNSINNSGGKVYIDYNIDGDFDDLDEEIGIIPYRDNSNIGVPEAITFTVPNTGAYGATRMRVVSQYNQLQDPNIIGSCDSPPSGSFSEPWYGATEDYSIVLNCPNSTVSYLWENGDTSDSIIGLNPGVYTVTITPSSGCAVQDSAIVTEPDEIIFNPEITNITCNSFTDGEISLNVSGANGGNYIIDWGTTNSLALGAGSYTVNVSDPTTITSTNSSACENDTTIVMDQPEYFSVEFTTSTNEICLDDPVTLDFDFNQGGFAPFTIIYTENSVSQSNIIINNTGLHNIGVSPTTGNNTYIITSIIDDEGCYNQNNITLENIYVNPNPDINISVNPSPICFGQNSTLILSAPNGTAPYNVEYFSGTNLETQNVPAAGSSILINPTNSTTYTLSYVIDDKGCDAFLSDAATLTVNEIPQLDTDYPAELCEGKPLEIDILFSSGVPPFNINYTFNGFPTSTIINNQQSTLSFIATNPTNIIITDISSNNCDNLVNETIAITTNPLPIATMNGYYELCDDPTNMEIAEITIETTTGNPLYNITYTNGSQLDSIKNASSNQVFNTNAAGTYSLISVIDSKGCEAIDMTGSATVIINPLPDAAMSVYPIKTEITDPIIYFKDISAYHSGGIWDFGNGESQATNFNTINHVYKDTGTYQVSLTTESPAGCQNTTYQTIIISPSFRIYIPNAFTPNNDLYNDYFMPIVQGVKDYEMTIYNRFGELVFNTSEHSNKYCIQGCKSSWDGKGGNGEYLNSGVFVYQIVIEDINGKPEEIEGELLLIR